MEEEKNRMNHEINLTGYTATCGEPNNMLDLGTAGSYGLEKLHVTADAVWDGLTITATFTNSGSTTVAVTDGAVDVPPEATRMPTRDRVRYGQIAFKGADAQGKLRIISTPIYYKVQASAATDGSNTIDPTPDQYAQFVAEVMAEADRAEAAADRAESAGGNVTPEQIAEAVNNYLTENPVQATTIDTTLTQRGQAADAKVVGDAIAKIELTPGPAGADGITPTIGSNGNWYLGDTDTGKPSRGETGPAGATPNIQIGTVETLEAGSAATASMTGTPENPLLNLGVPKGADGAGGGGNISLPLLYDLTTTEEVRWIDTGDNAFTANSFLVVELIAIATATNTNDESGSASMYPGSRPWDNQVIANTASALLPMTHDRMFRAFCFRGDGGHWSSITSIRTLVNAASVTPGIITARKEGVTDQPMRGIVIGDASALPGTRVLGIGSRLRVWGC
ncbi:MAG: hypothetical protein PUJ35_09820 [Ruminococcus bromii]|nr:hypothetical protein [Ruminococcus bromii]